MPAATKKRKAKGQPLRLPTTARAIAILEADRLRTSVPPRNPMYSWAYQCAADSSEVVQIHRSLENGNGPDGPEAWDPMCSVYFGGGIDPFLHPNDEPPDMGDGWQKIRWSQINNVIEALLDARDAAVRTGMLPPPMTLDEYRRRTEVPPVRRA